MAKLEITYNNTRIGLERYLELINDWVPTLIMKSIHTYSVIKSKIQARPTTIQTK